MPRGVKPLPTAIKQLTGRSPGRDSGGRKLPDEPQATPGVPDVPPELTGDALAAWHRFTADMDGMGVITHADRAALILLCQTWAMMMTAEKHVAANGLIVKLPNGFPAANPYLKVQRDSSATVLKLLTEFGLTPSARSRVKTTPAPDTEDDFFEVR